MFLFIDTVSSPAHYLLFDGEKQVVSEYSVEIKGQESERFLLSLEAFIQDYQMDFASLEWIVVVNGPGSFTAMRIVTLTINTLAFVHGTSLYPLDFFRLMSLSGLPYPMAIKANRGEYLVQRSAWEKPILMALSDLAPGSYSGIGSANDFANNSISIQWKLNYIRCIEVFPFGHGTNRIEPLYIKRPNIT